MNASAAAAVIVAAFVAAFAAIVGPVLLAWMTARQRAVERVQDYERQDEVARHANEVAEAAAEAAALLQADQVAVADQAREAAELLKENQVKVADTAATTLSTLQIIHTLVNSNLTAAMESELAEARESLRLMVELAAARGNPPDDLDSIALKEAKVAGMVAQLGDRLAQAVRVKAEVDEMTRQGIPPAPSLPTPSVTPIAEGSTS